MTTLKLCHERVPVELTLTLAGQDIPTYGCLVTAGEMHVEAAVEALGEVGDPDYVKIECSVLGRVWTRDKRTEKKGSVDGQRNFREEESAA